MDGSNELLSTILARVFWKDSLDFAEVRDRGTI